MSKVEGHFEITNQALNELKKEIPGSALLSGVPTVKGRLERGDTNHFIHGTANIAATDTENPAWGAVYRDLRDVWNGGHWKDSAQKHHFIRRMSGQNSRSAYEEAVKWIKAEATSSAKQLAANLKSGKKGNLFLGSASDHLGNAVHALQDSFSASHVKREGLDASSPGKIAKVYVYEGYEKKGHGHHDEAWTQGKAFSATGRNAINATKELIKMVVNSAASGQSTLQGWAQFQEKWLKTSPTLDKHHELMNKNLLNRFIHVYITDHGTTTVIQKQRLVDAMYRELSTDALNLKAVFLAFDDAHWAESDDLAELYAQKVRSTGGAALATLQGDRQLVKVLIRCLDEGWTTSGEQKVIDWLKTLL